MNLGTYKKTRVLFQILLSLYSLEVMLLLIVPGRLGDKL